MIRLLLILAVLIIPLRASAAATSCAGLTDKQCWDADYADEGTTDLSDYDDVVDTTPDIVSAMGYQGLSPQIRDEVWNKLNEAYSSGTNDGVDDITNPSDMATNVFDADETPVNYSAVFVGTDGRGYFGAKVAHALWIEVTSAVAWSLADYTEAELALLFDPNWLFPSHSTTPATDEPITSWNNNGDGLFFYSIDHSPKRAWDAVATLIGSLPSAPNVALDDLLLNNGLRHVFGGDPTHATTINQTLVDDVSRYGCHTASLWMVALARAINIPARIAHGYTDATGHASARFPSLDRLLVHGDDIYNAGRWYTAEQATDALSYFTTNVAPYDGDDLVKTDRRKFILIQWPKILAGAYDAAFCAQGMAYFDSLVTVDPPQDDHWLDALEAELITRTGCDP